MADRNPSKRNWQTYLSIGLSALGMVFFLIQAVTMGIVLLTSLIGGQTETLENIPTALLMWSALISGVLLLPVFILSLSQLKGKEAPTWLETSRPAIRKGVLWVILVWPAAVALGWLVAGTPRVAIYLLGPINVLVAGLPVVWIFNAASWKLTGGSKLRQWQIFGFSLTVMPFVVILMEIIAILILAVFGGLYVVYRMTVDPALSRELNLIFGQIATSPQDVEKILGVIEPYFLQPSVLFWVAAVMGGVMPIIEEIIKPIALWPLAKKEISPQEGFIGGMLCGAGFALTENLLYLTLAMNVGDWLFMAIGRAGTGVLHMLASGLVGWGLVEAWRHGKWKTEALLILGSFLLHGFWNALAFTVGLAPAAVFGSEPNFWQTMLINIPMIFLLILAVVGMVLINRYFRKNNEEESENQQESRAEKIEAALPESVIGQ